jgi:hypothetical protein
MLLVQFSTYLENTRMIHHQALEIQENILLNLTENSLQTETSAHEVERFTSFYPLNVLS